MSLRVPLAAAAIALAVLTPLSPAAAQEEREPLSEQQKEQEYARLFVEGLRAINARELERAEQIFTACRELFPDRPVASYNLACTRSLAGDTSRAVAALRQAFARGFRDLAHMNRDPDLDAIRREPAYRKALSDFEADLLRSSPAPLTYLPEGEGPFPVLVYVHGQRGRPESVLASLRQAFPDLALVVARGPEIPGEAGSHYWDGRAEFLTIRAARAFLRSNADRVDRDRVVAAGDAPGGGALAIGFAAHHPEVFTGGVIAAGGDLGRGASDLVLSDLRGYLVVQADAEDEVLAGVAARDAFAAAGSPVVLERYPAEPSLAADRALLLRGLAWLRGESVSLPGAGDVREF